MALNQTFVQISLAELSQAAKMKKIEGWSYVQTLAVNTEQGIDLVYTFRKDDALENIKVVAVQLDEVVPSITDTFLAAFVFENEIHDLFGVSISDIAIDFSGSFYALSQPEPMTIISPAQLAAREKAKKLEAAKLAKENGDKKTATPEDNTAIEAKLASMDPAKAAMVRAAMEAKKKKEQEAKIASLNPEKAAKVKAALAAKARRAASEKKGEE